MENKVIHPLNFFPSSEYPAFETNADVPNIGDNCTDKIECDLYYQPDWEFVLKAEFTCAEISAKKPCFGTYACVCDNDYKSISASMPEPSSEKLAESISASMPELSSENLAELNKQSGNSFGIEDDDDLVFGYEL